MNTLQQVTLLALEEGVPPDHIAATIVPIIGALFFCGSVYILLWSIYGAKKGALIYGTAFFGFGALIGVFWWFGAPGTPVATGLTYFPGQANDQYSPKWYPMEPGSERADNFEITNSLDAFQTPEEFLGLEGVSEEELERSDRYSELTGDLSQSIEQMLSIYLPSGDGGTPVIGAERRQRLTEAAGQPQEGETPATPFFTARAEPDEDGDPIVLVARDQGLRLAGAPLQVVANFDYTDEQGAPKTREVVVEESNFFAFQDPGAIWFPSAVWTAIMGVLALGCLLGLDRVEMREKRTVKERQPVGATAGSTASRSG